MAPIGAGGGVAVERTGSKAMLLPVGRPTAAALQEALLPGGLGNIQAADADTEEEEEPEAEVVAGEIEAPVEDSRRMCSSCGRKFNPTSFERHQRVCQQVFGSTRPTFDPMKGSVVSSKARMRTASPLISGQTMMPPSFADVPGGDVDSPDLQTIEEQERRVLERLQRQMDELHDMKQRYYKKASAAQLSMEVSRGMEEDSTANEVISAFLQKLQAGYTGGMRDYSPPTQGALNADRAQESSLEVGQLSTSNVELTCGVSPGEADSGSSSATVPPGPPRSASSTAPPGQPLSTMSSASVPPGNSASSASAPPGSAPWRSQLLGKVKSLNSRSAVGSSAVVTPPAPANCHNSQTSAASDADAGLQPPSRQDSALQACEHCGRRFNAASLEKHRAVCRSVFGKPADKSARQASTSDLNAQWGRPPPGPPPASARSYEAKTPPVVDTPPQTERTVGLSRGGNSGRLLKACPHCGRLFRPSAFDTHVGVCQSVFPQHDTPSRNRASFPRSPRGRDSQQQHLRTRSTSNDRTADDSSQRHSHSPTSARSQQKLGARTSSATHDAQLYDQYSRSGVRGVEEHGGVARSRSLSPQAVSCPPPLSRPGLGMVRAPGVPLDMPADGDTGAAVRPAVWHRVASPTPTPRQPAGTMSPSSPSEIRAVCEERASRLDRARFSMKMSIHSDQTQEGSPCVSQRAPVAPASLSSAAASSSPPCVSQRAPVAPASVASAAASSSPPCVSQRAPVASASPSFAAPSSSIRSHAVKPAVCSPGLPAPKDRQRSPERIDTGGMAVEDEFASYIATLHPDSLLSAANRVAGSEREFVSRFPGHLQALAARLWHRCNELQHVQERLQLVRVNGQQRQRLWKP